MSSPVSIEVVVQRAGQVVARHRLVPGAPLVVGSGPDAGCRLDDPLVSPRHASLLLGPAGVVALDLDSDTGTTSGGTPLAPGTPAVIGLEDTLEVGDHVLALRGPTRPVGPETRRMLDDYEPLKELGKGAAGTVFLARHRVSGREVAVKLLHAELGADATERERFVRESQVGRRIHSPHVVSVIEARVEGPRAFLAMELLRGQSLRDRILAGPMPVAEVVRVGLGIARGLGAAHAAGVIHRDVKPGNVMLGDDGSVKVADFGLAKDATSAQLLTRTREGMGTLAYLAPEQASDAKRVDGRADLYSLGATLFHAVAGRPPFVSAGADIIRDIFEAEPPDLTSLRPDCPPALAQLVTWCLQKDPDDRPPEAGLVASALLDLSRRSSTARATDRGQLPQ